NRGPVFIPLKDVSKNSYILLIMIDKSDGITGVIGDTLFGNSSEIFQFILFRDFDQIILWGVYFAIAIIALFLYIIDRDKINYFFLAVCALSMLGFSLMQTDVMFLLDVKHFLLKYVDWVSGRLTVISYLIFLSITSKIRSILILAAAVTAFGVYAPMMNHSHIVEAYMGFDPLAGITMGIAILAVLIFTKDKVIKRVFVYSFLFVVPTTAHDLLVMNGFLPPERMTMPWGVAATFFPFIFHQIRTFTSAEKSLLEKDNELLQERLNNLKDKMKPHFVLNTLTIISTFLLKDSKKAKETLDCLTNCYHFLLRNDDKQIVPLNTELEFVKNYGNLLMLKFSDVLKIKYKITGNTDKWLIPTLTLQPIVENAYKHGVRKVKKGEIHINVDAAPDIMKITVSNTNNGKPAGEAEERSLTSIRRRLQYFFENAEITFSINEKRTDVQIVYGRKKDLQVLKLERSLDG
ncbi:MAG: histidine kinase, partial [Spirochaetia bacterium]|nr:histidine kinase [Spirochaetia bacterium]